MAEREQLEDALKLLYDALDSGETVRSADLPVSAELVAAELARDAGDGTLALTDAGREYALQVIRAHRLYETYLAHRTGHPADEWHRQAHAVEHTLDAEAVEDIARALGDPLYDPHGDPIPTADGQLPPPRGCGLSERPVGWAGRIIHVEDEPPELYQVLAQAGFAPDVRLRIEATGTDGTTVRVAGHTVTLSAAQAALVQCDELRPDEVFDASVIRLRDLREGETAEVVSISPLVRGLARSRLLDLGVVPGSVLTIALRGPGGQPVAYLIRGATIALREEQTERIMIRRRAASEAA